MRPFVVNGEAWRVVRAVPGDPLLIDRTGTPRLATCDPSTHVIAVSAEVTPPLLDRVLLHEVTHAVTMSHDLLPPIRGVLPEHLWVPVEEWAVQLTERFAMEALTLTSESLGRPVCVRGYCSDRLGDRGAGDQRAGDPV